MNSKSRRITDENDEDDAEDLMMILGSPSCAPEGGRQQQAVDQSEQHLQLVQVSEY